MLRSMTAGLMLAMLSSAAVAQAPAAPPAPGRGAAPALHAVTMAVTSTAFESGTILPDRFSGKANVDGKLAPSPPLAWTGVPAGTQSFALIMHDLDVVMAKSTRDNLHWLAFNIPAAARGMPEGVPNTPTLPDGTIQARNRVGIGFDGPGAPATGPYHHYVIEVWALDAKLALDATATRDDVLAAMDGHVLDKGTLVARFHR